jgi:hypothetical protein
MHQERFSWFSFPFVNAEKVRAVYYVEETTVKNDRRFKRAGEGIGTFEPNSGPG